MNQQLLRENKQRYLSYLEAKSISQARCSTEVQRVSFVGYTGGEGGSLRLWNLQNLHAVPS